MELDLIYSNLLNPPILFFFLGMLAVACKSDLQVPAPIPKLFSLYLLLCIGFKGGVAISKSGINAEVITTLAAAVVISAAIPIYLFFILKKKMGAANAGAIAATYGSVSAVTFIAATDFLKSNGVDYGGHMVAALALMESPAIIVGLVMAKLFHDSRNKEALNVKEILREALFSGPVFLIIGSVFIGVMTGEQGASALKPFTTDIFKGMLVFFLLDMGIMTAQRLSDLRHAGVFLVSFAVIVPVVNAMIGLAAAYMLGFSAGNAFLFIILCASASYIAVPAAMRLSLKESNPSIYLPMSLGVTFPINIIIGMPVYFALVRKLF